MTARPRISTQARLREPVRPGAARPRRRRAHAVSRVTRRIAHRIKHIHVGISSNPQSPGDRSKRRRHECTFALLVRDGARARWAQLASAERAPPVQGAVLVAFVSPPRFTTIVKLGVTIVKLDVRSQLLHLV